MQRTLSIYSTIYIDTTLTPCYLIHVPYGMDDFLLKGNIMNYKAFDVCCLPEVLQTKIYKAVKRSLSANGLFGEELAGAIQNAMNSKVSDLSDTINISRVLRGSK